VFGWMIAPHTGVDARALVFRSAGLSNFGVREHTMAPVEPAVRPPGEGVERLMRILIGPAIQQDLRVGLVMLCVVPVSILITLLAGAIAEGNPRRTFTC